MRFIFWLWFQFRYHTSASFRVYYRRERYKAHMRIRDGRMD